MSIRIESESLTVEIGKPGNYTGSRFDWTGFIKQVTLRDYGHTFCTVESHKPGQGTGGKGLCNEFGIRAPIGYDNVEIGQQFPKIGVGLLTRTNEKPYDFFSNYAVDPFVVHTDTTTDSVRFVSEAKNCRGYAVIFEKVISVKGYELNISYTLDNVGTEPIVTNEYVHNFIALNNKPIGPDYVLRFPNEVMPSDEISELQREGLSIENNEILWKEPVSKVFYSLFAGFQNPTPPYYWELVHKKEKVGLRESGSEAVSSMALWGEPHVVSPEVFIDINIKPGEIQKWNRTFKFFTTE